jgi:type IX secretion system PorP/SprF family membrane protein
MRTITAIILLLAVNATQAQDFTYSQFYETPLMRNPALAGIFNGNIRIQSAYRNQWNSVTVPYETKSLSAEVTFPFEKTKDLLTIGLQVNSDIAGTSRLNRLQLLPVISFHKAFNDEVSYLTFATMGGLVQSQFDFSKLQFNDQFINGQGPVGATNANFDKTNISYGDASTGLAFNSSMGDDHRYYVGVACYHFLKSKVSFTDADNLLLKKRWVTNAGISLHTGDWDRTYIYGDFIMQGGHRQFLSGILYSHVLKSYVTYADDAEDNVSLMAGAAYRWGDAFIPILKLEMKNFYVGASYDINISKLKSASQYRGGFEFSMAYISTLNSIMRRSVAESVGCPVRF